MKSASHAICFQEIPDEISLSFAISNCPNNCEGCHSPWLREDCGEDLYWLLPQLLKKYQDKTFFNIVLFVLISSILYSKKRFFMQIKNSETT